jgi:3-oxoacyl-[acyl-carrier protein] reductase
LIQNIAEKKGQSIAKVTQEMEDSVPAGRFADPYETAAAVVFLAAPQAAYINGINLPVDGGRTQSL